MNKLDWQGFNIFKIKLIRILSRMDKINRINHFQYRIKIIINMGFLKLLMKTKYKILTAVEIP
jgi:hypothetical protein